MRNNKFCLYLFLLLFSLNSFADTITNWQLYAGDSLIYADNILNPIPAVPLITVTAKNSVNKYTFYNRHCVRETGVEKHLIFVNQNNQEVARMDLNDQDGFAPVSFHANDVTKNNLVKEKDLIRVYYSENGVNVNRLIGQLKFEIVPAAPQKWYWKLITIVCIVFGIGTALYFRAKRVWTREG